MNRVRSCSHPRISRSTQSGDAPPLSPRPWTHAGEATLHPQRPARVLAFSTARSPQPLLLPCRNDTAGKGTGMASPTVGRASTRAHCALRSVLRLHHSWATAADGAPPVRFPALNASAPERARGGARGGSLAPRPSRSARRSSAAPYVFATASACAPPARQDDVDDAVRLGVLGPVRRQPLRLLTRDNSVCRARFSRPITSE